MACDAASLAEAVAANVCGVDSRRSLLALAGVLYLMTGQDAQTAMENAKCFSGLEDAALSIVIAAELCNVT